MKLNLPALVLVAGLPTLLHAQPEEPAPLAVPDAVLNLDGSVAAADPTPMQPVAELPPAMDRSGWRLPSASPAPTETLELWNEDCYRCAVEDRFEPDVREAPSVVASLEGALGVYD